MLPYFRKAEDNERGDDDFHGAGGPLGVSDVRDEHPLAKAFVAAAVEAGYPRNDDFNGATQEGAGHYQTTMRGGVRSSTAAAYLKEARRRGNLHVVPNALASRVLFHGRRATGVEYLAGGETRDRFGRRRGHRRVGGVQLAAAPAIVRPRSRPVISARSAFR